MNNEMYGMSNMDGGPSLWQMFLIKGLVTFVKMVSDFSWT